MTWAASIPARALTVAMASSRYPILSMSFDLQRLLGDEDAAVGQLLDLVGARARPGGLP